MRYWYDTEFLDDGRTIDLISIGVVAEDGREYYAVNQDADWPRIFNRPWLVENVWPYLPHRRRPSADGIMETLDWSHPDVKSKQVMAEELSKFLTGTRSTTELWAYYGSYDHVALAQIFGKMLDLPDHVPMYTHDLKQELDRLGVDVYDLGIENTNLHNALDDARWNKAVYDALADR